MPSSSQDSTGGRTSHESSGRGRHLYLIEIVLGAGLLLMVVLIYLSNNPHGRNNDQEPAHANIVTLTAANWKKEVLQSPVPVVVDFWAPRCGPCKMLSPAIDRVAERFAGKVKVGKLNVDSAQAIARRYG